jgi:hypothetical protein
MPSAQTGDQPPARTADRSPEHEAGRGRQPPRAPRIAAGRRNCVVGATAGLEARRMPSRRFDEQQRERDPTCPRRQRQWVWAVEDDGILYRSASRPPGETQTILRRDVGRNGLRRTVALLPQTHGFADIDGERAVSPAGQITSVAGGGS